MKALAKSSRVNSALQVIQLMNDGMSVVDACKAVGIPRSSYYHTMRENPEAVAEIQAIIEANKREQLGLILMSQNEILKKVIDAGLAEETKPRDRLAIFQKLNEIANTMTKSVETESDIERQAQEFLSHGPQLVPGRSRFTATQTTVTIETDQ